MSCTKNQSRVGHRPVVEAKTLNLPEESTGKCLHSEEGKDLGSKSHKGGSVINQPSAKLKTSAQEKITV